MSASNFWNGVGSGCAGAGLVMSVCVAEMREGCNPLVRRKVKRFAYQSERVSRVLKVEMLSPDVGRGIGKPYQVF